MNLRELGEFGLIARLTDGIESTRSEMVVGVGDDASVIDIGGDRLLLWTCDAQIEGVHFRREWLPPEGIGRRAAVVNLSDIAAMGGEPAFALVSLMVPDGVGLETLEGLYSGIRAGFSRWNVDIVGGNTARSEGGLIIDVTLLGFGAMGQVLLRNGATPGDVLCVTGDLGSVSAGIAVLSENCGTRDETVLRNAKEAIRGSRPRITEGQILSHSGEVTACMDISDGLVSDAGHLAKQSNVVVNVDLDRVPVSPDTVELCTWLQKDPQKVALAGGEDYELLFTVRKEGLMALADEVTRETGTKVTPIGEVTEGPCAVRFKRNGQEVELDGLGFDHFRR